MILQIKLTKEKLARESTFLFTCVYVSRSSQKNVIQRAVKIWGLYAIVIGEGDKKKGTFRETNDFLER